VLPPLAIERPDAPDAVARLTALHTAVLEEWVRRHPHMWFWLHRRWKSPPPAAAGAARGAADGAAAAAAPLARGA
jgi:lauroyl/myristoyl acyltransferase